MLELASQNLRNCVFQNGFDLIHMIRDRINLRPDPLAHLDDPLELGFVSAEPKFPLLTGNLAMPIGSVMTA